MERDLLLLPPKPHQRSRPFVPQYSVLRASILRAPGCDDFTPDRSTGARVNTVFSDCEFPVKDDDGPRGVSANLSVSSWLAGTALLLDDRCAFSGPSCSSGFTYVSAASACYKAGSSMVTWSQAVDGCKSFDNNARLVVISSSQEQSAVVNWWKYLPGNNTANSTKCMHFISK